MFPMRASTRHLSLLQRGQARVRGLASATFLSLLLVGLLAGCGSGGAPGQLNNQQSNVASGTSSLIDGVTILDSGTANQIISSNDTSIVFAGTPAAITNLKAGDVFIVQNTARQVLSVGTVNGQTVVQTITPELSEVFKHLQIDASVLLSEKEIDRSSLSGKVTLATIMSPPVASVTSTQQGSTFTLTITDEVIYDADSDPNTKLDQVLANGTVVLESPQVDANFNFGVVSQTYASINFKAGEKVDVTVSSLNLSFNKSASVPLLTFLVPIAVTGGTVNITISLNLVFEANGSAKITAGIAQELSYDAGMKATLGPASLESTNRTSYKFDIKQPRFEGEVTALVAVNPDVDARLLQYSLAGITNSIGVKVDAKANATLTNACLRTLADAELSATAFVMLPRASLHFNFSWSNFSFETDIGMQKYPKELFRLTKPIYDSGSLCVVGNNPPIANAGLNVTAYTNSTVFLNGTRSLDSDGTITAYSWIQNGGKQVALLAANTSTPSFSAPSTADTLTFNLTVTDNRGSTSVDSVAVSIIPITNSSPGFLRLSVSKKGFGLVSSSPAGIDCGQTCSASFSQGQMVSLTAVADSGFTFGGWLGACANLTGPCNVRMTSNQIVQALFNPIGGGTSTLSVTKTGSGTVTSNPAGISCGATCASSFASGGTVTLTATAASGSTFTGWSGGGCSGAGTCTVTMNVGQNVTATFNLVSPPPPTYQGTWSATGSMGIVRFDHTATLLPNGKVLVAAGRNSAALAIESAELYDPATGTWSGTGNLITARDTHTATLLQDGKVLVAGGILPEQGSTASAELYNPATGTWADTGSMGTSRSDHSATVLSNGKVLVAGGRSNGGTVSSAELYDPTTGTWTSTGSMPSTRDGHTATLLLNGKVLVAGGEIYPPSSQIASSHLYDPNTGTWSSTGSLNTARAYHTATLLPNGKVLGAGGFGNGSSQALSTAEVYDSNTGAWSRTGNLNTARVFHPATILPNGKVLVAGGAPSIFPRGALASAELYDLNTGTWTATGSMATDRDDVQAAMVLLNTGHVLMTGGVTTNGTKLSSAELFLQR